MLVLILIAIAAILLGHGYATESTDEVVAALVVSVVATLVVVGERVVARRRGVTGPGTPTAEGVAVDEDDVVEAAAVTDVESQSGPEADTEADDPEVVFTPGRTTFHLRTCPTMRDKPTSASTRSQLEAGGMTACKRCL